MTVRSVVIVLCALDLGALRSGSKSSKLRTYHLTHQVLVLVLYQLVKYSTGNVAGTDNQTAKRWKQLKQLMFG